MWRHHRRFMTVIHEVDRAVAQVEAARTPEQARGRFERAAELLEYADVIRKEKP